VSNSLTGTVQQILTYLQTAYGRISPQMLEDREQELRNLSYNPRLPIDVVFNAVEDYVDFAELALQPMSQLQSISKAYIVINKTRRFKTAITEWNRRPTADKTWINFKTHFRQAHQEFRETTDVTVEESELQRSHANLVRQVVEGVQTAMTPAVTPADTSDPSSELIQQMANSANQTSETQQHLLAQLAQMQHAMQQLQMQASQQPLPFQHHHNTSYQQYQHQDDWSSRGRGRGRARGRGRGRGRQGGRFPLGNGPPRVRTFNKYCWTHGGCAHTGTDCLYQVPGHKTEATFEDKMGGSTLNCPST